NGFIEGRELDNFLREFVSSVSLSDVGPEVSDTSVLWSLSLVFSRKTTAGRDARYSVRPLAQLLPLEESFLLLFRFDNPLESSVEFMKLINVPCYDGDGLALGTQRAKYEECKIRARDLRLTERRQQKKKNNFIPFSPKLLQKITSRVFFSDELTESTAVLPVIRHVLLRHRGRGASKLTREDIERVFALYDRDKNGTIENEELKGFLKDLLELVKKDYDAQDLEEFQEAILRGCDFNKDGKISKKELTMVLLALAKHSADEDGK
ncbi:unnamed protein product, partial [Ixodes hexagonus]